MMLLLCGKIPSQRSGTIPGQVQKVYGPNNSILDNCHVRIAFAANDERTAKRISDALGQTTEQRAQRNYAGHRLAPWLSHVMVSSQETQRALLTPGEVMQLPPDDEIVMVSGVRPIRAKKLRYYADENFTSRVAPAADTSNPPPGSRNDWQGMATPPVFDLPNLERHANEASDEGGHEQKLSLDPPKQSAPEVEIEPSPELTPNTDDFDEAARNGLKPAQRALGLEQGGNDALPDF